MKPWWAIGGVILPAIVIMAVTLVAAVSKPLQGILLTAEGFGYFIALMLLIPMIRVKSAAFYGVRPGSGADGGNAQHS